MKRGNVIIIATRLNATRDRYNTQYVLCIMLNLLFFILFCWYWFVHHVDAVHVGVIVTALFVAHSFVG